jgi:ABC-type glycerol-3-phosphate transport system substrate-binding protein
VNAFSEDRDVAYALIDYLLQPTQLLERARVTGEYPPYPEMYETQALGDALKMNPGDARRVIEGAVARPATPVYTELSEVLQIALHRALTDQQDARAALREAAASMREILDRAGLSPRS